jgi:hypothetical protein
MRVSGRPKPDDQWIGSTGGARPFGSPLLHFVLSLILLVAVLTSSIGVRMMTGTMALPRTPNVLRRNFAICPPLGRTLPTQQTHGSSTASAPAVNHEPGALAEHRKNGWALLPLPSSPRLPDRSGSLVCPVVPPLRC